MAFYKSSRKSFNSIYAIKEMNREKLEKNRTYDEDFIIRRNINQIIINGVNDGKSNEEIIEELSQDEKNLKYVMYFENWINDRRIKLEKNKKIKKDNEDWER